jgi:hypothetical protein
MRRRSDAPAKRTLAAAHSALSAVYAKGASLAALAAATTAEDELPTPRGILPHKRRPGCFTFSDHHLALSAANRLDDSECAEPPHLPTVELDVLAVTWVRAPSYNPPKSSLRQFRRRRSDVLIENGEEVIPAPPRKPPGLRPQVFTFSELDVCFSATGRVPLDSP